DYRRRGPVSNAFFCLLRQNGPLYLEDGTQIPHEKISNRGNRSDKHHIFPRSLLDRHKVDPEKAHSILNVCYLVARENQSIGKRAPYDYLATVPRNIRIRNRALKSHF